MSTVINSNARVIYLSNSLALMQVGERLCQIHLRHTLRSAD